MDTDDVAIVAELRRRLGDPLRTTQAMALFLADHGDRLLALADEAIAARAKISELREHVRL